MVFMIIIECFAGLSPCMLSQIRILVYVSDILDSCLWGNVNLRSLFDFLLIIIDNHSLLTTLIDNQLITSEALSIRFIDNFYQYQ